MVRAESIIAPILRTVLDGFTSTSPTETVHSEETAYKGLVRPVIEYFSPVWNPQEQKYINLIEMVQCSTAHPAGGTIQVISPASCKSLNGRKRAAGGAGSTRSVSSRYSLDSLLYPHHL